MRKQIVFFVDKRVLFDSPYKQQFLKGKIEIGLSTIRRLENEITA